MPALSDYNTAMEAVATALAADDFTEARKQLRIARAHALRLPSAVNVDGLNVQRQSLDQIDKLEDAITREEGRSQDGEVHSRWVP